MDRDKVIKGLEYHSDPVYGCDVCPYTATDGDEDCGWRELCKDALALLKEQEPRVLILDEVLQDDRLLWVEWIGCNCGGLSPTASKCNGDFSVAFHNGEVHPIGLYGKQWRCWDRKPTDEQREGTPWQEC